MWGEMEEKGEIFPAPRAVNGSKDSKWWSSSLGLILSELEKYVLSLNIGSVWLR
jgi:hypothetical protein